MHEVAADVWQLAGFPRHAFNVYLAGDVLFDAGTRYSRRRIFRQLGERKLSLVALTHCHPDHQGSAKAVCERYGVGLAVHAADAAATEGRAPMQPDCLGLSLSMALWGGPPCPAARSLSEGDMVAGFRVIHAPGHTPGEVIYFRESDRVAIAGDVVNNMNLYTTIPGLHEPPAMFSSDPAENRRSIRKLAALRPSLVLVGHGPPLGDIDALDRFAESLG
jgi:glyoxylase-like metal-dependent hydrolase (beta-lactamase superfamily II)